MGDLPAHRFKKRQIKFNSLTQKVLEISSQLIYTFWDIESQNLHEQPGLYTKVGKLKIASIGMSYRRFFSSHGIAINIRNNLGTFQYIQACGNKAIQLNSISQYLQSQSKQRSRKNGTKHPQVTDKSVQDFLDSWKKTFFMWLGEN